MSPIVIQKETSVEPDSGSSIERTARGWNDYKLSSRLSSEERLGHGMTNSEQYISKDVHYWILKPKKCCASAKIQKST